MTGDLERLEAYRRILARALPDDAARAARQTQPAPAPSSAVTWLWPVWARRYQAAAPLVAHDERFVLTEEKRR